MGLSASQARLLSLTQRINNNELESEMISNAKIHLAARNTIASENYINALDGTKLDTFLMTIRGRRRRFRSHLTLLISTLR